MCIVILNNNYYMLGNIDMYYITDVRVNFRLHSEMYEVMHEHEFLR